MSSESNLDRFAIRRARSKAMLTQAQLADKVGCARNSISRAELGECSYNLACRIADVLRIDVANFYTRKDPPDNIGKSITQKQAQVLDIMRRNSHAEEVILNFARGVEAATDEAVRQ